MDKAKPPGISVERITLLHCAVGIVRPEATPEFNLAITDMERQFSDDNLIMSASVSFDLMHGIKEPLCMFKCGYQVTYSRPPEANMKWEELSDALAITHVIPFLRELIVSMMGKMSLPVLLLPPTNVYAMVDQYKALKGVAVATIPAPQNRLALGTANKPA